MPIIQTPKELGVAIRSRRKKLGWDQATLAKHVGVTRQWVIDIEKGKPRAELALAMRAVRVLGMSLALEEKPKNDVDESKPTYRKHPASQLDINDIVEKNRGLTAHNYLNELDAMRSLDDLSGSGSANAVALMRAEAESLKRLQKSLTPELPKTALDYVKELDALRPLDALGSSVSARAVAHLQAETKSLKRLQKSLTPELPKTALDYVKELDAFRALKGQRPRKR